MVCPSVNSSLPVPLLTYSLTVGRPLFYPKILGATLGPASRRLGGDIGTKQPSVSNATVNSCLGALDDQGACLSYGDHHPLVAKAQLGLCYPPFPGRPASTGHRAGSSLSKEHSFTVRVPIHTGLSAAV